MAVPVNIKTTMSSGIGEKQWIPLNMWASPYFTIVVTTSGLVVYDIEATLDKVLTDADATAFIMDDGHNTPISGQTGNLNLELAHTPVTAIRVNQTSGTGQITLHICQSGLNT